MSSTGFTVPFCKCCQLLAELSGQFGGKPLSGSLQSTHYHLLLIFSPEAYFFYLFGLTGPRVLAGPGSSDIHLQTGRRNTLDFAAVSTSCPISRGAKHRLIYAIISLSIKKDRRWVQWDFVVLFCKCCQLLAELSCQFGGKPLPGPFQLNLYTTMISCLIFSPEVYFF
jgi:hypothetical protein